MTAPGVKNLPWRDHFFQYPEQIDEALKWLQSVWVEKEVYFSPMLWDRSARRKEHVLYTPCAWADLDDCPPDKLELTPTYLINTSKDRYSALWKFNEEVDPMAAENISLRIARRYEEFGADQGGWDLTQALRVPYTVNYKRSLEDPWLITVEINPESFTMDEFSILPEAAESELEATLPFPAPDQIPGMSAEEILQLHKSELPMNVWDMFSHQPMGDWSDTFWSLCQMLAASGMTPEEGFVVAQAAACNKIKRDKRSPKALWKYYIVKAWGARGVPPEAIAPENRGAKSRSKTVMHVDLLSTAERREANKYLDKTILYRYMNWGESVMDAPRVYHQAGILVILSSLLSGVLKLPTSFGTIIPNLWVMILADSTLTRKSSSMDLATDLLMEIEPDAMLATDGSIEGIMQALSTRPSKPSLFLRDEFSGLLDSFNKKDYYSGMAEMLTKLYDGKVQKRILRRETIVVTKPIFILYAGGIKNRILDLFNYSYVYSGFIPRFIFVTATTDTSKLKPLGPPSSKSEGEREIIRQELSKIYDHYQQEASVTIGGQRMEVGKRPWNVELTPEAWDRYNRIEQHLIKCAMDSINPDLFKPVFDRLAKSGLKVAMLIAAATRREDRVEVTIQDIYAAFYLCEGWIAHAIEVIINIGRSEIEKTINAVYNSILNEPGISKSELMNRHHITSRGTAEIFDTLQQRGLITIGKGRGLYAIGSEEEQDGRTAD